MNIYGLCNLVTRESKGNDTNIFVIAEKYYSHFTFLSNLVLAFVLWLHMKISISLYFFYLFNLLFNVASEIHTA